MPLFRSMNVQFNSVLNIWPLCHGQHKCIVCVTKSDLVETPSPC